MQEVFEKIIEKLEEYMDKNLAEHDSEQSQHCKDVGDCGMRDCALCVFDKAIEIVKQTAEELAIDNNVGDNGWIPCGEPPETGVYVLLSFSNFSVPTVGRYEEDEKGGAYYIGDEDKKCTQQDMFVNAWQPLPDPYNPHICTNNDCVFNERKDCPAAGGCGGYEQKQTNADRIRSMSDEEFAEFWLKHCDNPIMNFNEDICDLCNIYGNESGEKCDDDYCIKAIVKWLQSEA